MSSALTFRRAIALSALVSLSVHSLGRPRFITSSCIRQWSQGYCNLWGCATTIPMKLIVAASAPSQRKARQSSHIMRRSCTGLAALGWTALRGLAASGRRFQALSCIELPRRSRFHVSRGHQAQWTPLVCGLPIPDIYAGHFSTIFAPPHG